jgi:hypothetical protein
MQKIVNFGHTLYGGKHYSGREFKVFIAWKKVNLTPFHIDVLKGYLRILP